MRKWRGALGATLLVALLIPGNALAIVNGEPDWSADVPGSSATDQADAATLPSAPSRSNQSVASTPAGQAVSSGKVQSRFPRWADQSGG